MKFSNNDFKMQHNSSLEMLVYIDMENPFANKLYL